MVVISVMCCYSVLYWRSTRALFVSMPMHPVWIYEQIKHFESLNQTLPGSPSLPDKNDNRLRNQYFGI